jgi:hypothetical protein
LLRSLAYGKPVIASCDAQQDYVPENIVDGMPDNSQGWQAATSKQWVEIDLQKDYPVDRVRVFPYYNGKRCSQYTVEASQDEKTWTMVADMSAATTPDTASGNDHRFKALPARYIRVNMLKSSDNPGVHLNEVLVFGASQERAQ